MKSSSKKAIAASLVLASSVVPQLATPSIACAETGSQPISVEQSVDSDVVTMGGAPVDTAEDDPAGAHQSLETPDTSYNSDDIEQTNQGPSENDSSDPAGSFDDAIQTTEDPNATDVEAPKDNADITSGAMLNHSSLTSVDNKMDETPLPDDGAASERSDAKDESNASRADGWYRDEDGFWRWSQKGSDVEGWLVTDYLPGQTTGSGLQRYWLEDGKLSFFDQVFQATINGVTDWFYATNQGFVSRGKLIVKKADGTYIYLSDNEGRLEDGGWLVTDRYDNGQLQRYWIDKDAHAAIAGQYSAEGGYGHVTDEQGWTARGAVTIFGQRYIADNDGRLTRNNWVVTGAFSSGNLERYWAGDDGAFATDQLVDAGGGWYAYATSNGAVVRGVKRVGNLVYLADNDGRLASAGWVVSDRYGQGLQRYWIDGQKHAAVIGYSKEGWGHYTLTTGYVLRGKYDTGGGLVYVADNDGRLASAQAPDANGSGWLVTGKYDGGVLQRYWIDGVTGAARSGLFTADGASRFGVGGQGYVARGALVTSFGSFFADNEGVLKKQGWLVTDAFGAGLQRYWFEDYKVATNRLIDADIAGYWAYARPEGYVVRGKYLASNGNVYLANNDGKLENAGWLVTSSYDPGSLQRYYIDGSTHAARTGLFQVGAESYMGLTDKGYVLRGTKSINGKTYHADNDGMLVLSFATSASTEKDDVKTAIQSTFVGDSSYLFLPAHGDIAAVPLLFETFDGADGVLLSLGGKDFALYASGSVLDLSSLDINSSGARVIRFKTSEHARERVLAVMISANINAMYLVSDDPINEGRPYIEGSPDHSTKTTGTMLYVKPTGEVIYNGELSQIKGRGNTTWGDPKKPYQIKLDKKTDLLELGDDEKAKTWILLANANDATLLHNSIAYQLASLLGLSETPQFAPIDLYYDGEYRGSYLLCEKVEINGGRIDIDKLEDAIEDANPDVDLDDLPLATGSNRFGYTFQYVQGVENPEDITGGYLIEFDVAYYQSERCWFDTSLGAFVVKEPGNLSYQQMLYISEFVQEAINKVVAGQDASDYIDVESCAKVWTVNEFAKNIDWGASSAYYFLPSASDKNYSHVLYGGAIWDFDASFGIRKDVPTANDPNGLFFSGQYGIVIWFQKNAAVYAETKDIMLNELIPLAEQLLKDESAIDGMMTISEMTDQIRDSQRMNEVLWGLRSFGNCYPPKPTFEENIDYLRSWISSRIVWLKKYFGTA